MGKELIDELFAKPDIEFAEHINDNDNARILFSGKFGIGKTTFINHFFEKNENDFVKIHLFPVNYSIASNEDIMELVKYDILMELIREGAEFTSEDISFKERIVGFTKNNAQELVKLIAKKIPSLGGEDIAGIGISELVDDLSKLYKSFQEYCEEAKQDEGEAANEFLEMIQAEKGSIYEQGIVTKLIRDKVSALKNKKNHTKKVVLVIDDLDRIDPEHIFRLFNVFAAHFDSSDCDSSSNKFDFDKVVFVCDVNNIRSIFKHRYGAETDFGGYIDKFFSKEIFEFDNVYNLKDVVKLLTDKIYYPPQINKNQNDNITNIKELLSIFIETAIHLRIITLRNLCKYIEKQVTIDANRSFHLRGNVIEKEIDHIFIISCRIIRSFFGNELELMQLLKNNQNKQKVPDNIQNLEKVIDLAFSPLYMYKNKEIPPYYSGVLITLNNSTILKQDENSEIDISTLHDSSKDEFLINILYVFHEGILFTKELDKSNGVLNYDTSIDLVHNN